MTQFWIKVGNFFVPETPDFILRSEFERFQDLTRIRAKGVEPFLAPRAVTGTRRAAEIAAAPFARGRTGVVSAISKSRSLRKAAQELAPEVLKFSRLSKGLRVTSVAGLVFGIGLTDIAISAFIGAKAGLETKGSDSERAATAVVETISDLLFLDIVTAGQSESVEAKAVTLISQAADFIVAPIAEAFGSISKKAFLSLF